MRAGRAATAVAVIHAPLASITDAKGTMEFNKDGAKTLMGLRERLQQVQHGEIEDKHGWMVEVAV